MPKSPEEAAAWYLARKKFETWCLMCNKELFRWAAHHRILGEALQNVAFGEITKLAVLMPRSSAKSTYASRLFVPWYLNVNLTHSIIAASHTLDLAEENGGKARNYMEALGHIFGLGMLEGSAAKARWGTRQGGEYFGVGVGGSVVGRRADLVLLDDLLGGVEDADSKLVRDKVWDWLIFDLVPCMKPGARMILVNNRWHEDDVAGRLFDPKNEHYNAAEAAKWTVLKMPLVCEQEEGDLLGRKVGDLMWPEFYTPEMVAGYKRNSRSWNAQYQQRPAPDEGAFFLRDHLIGYQPSELPSDLRIYMASDHAVSTKQTADKTVLLVAGVCKDGYIWVLPETKWGRFTSDETVETALDLAAAKKPLTWFAEKGHISQSIGPFLRKRMRERGVYVAIQEMTPTKDKMTRAQSIHGRMAQGMVRFPKFAPWWNDAEAEILTFPNGTHDDVCDAISWLGIGLEQHVGPSVAAQKKPEAPRYTGRWLEESEDRKNRFRRMHEAMAGW